MNCDTGEITNNPELIKLWKEMGHRVVELPTANPCEELEAAEAAETYTTPPVAPQPKPDSPEKRLARALNNARLNQLCGKR